MPRQSDDTVGETTMAGRTMRPEPIHAKATAERPRPPKRAGRRKLKLVPNQHGAWAFLIVPLLLGLMQAGWSWLGLVFAVAWVVAYPLSFYAARVVRVRLRRGSLTPSARRDLTAALVWSGLIAPLAVVLLISRPWLILVGVFAAVFWGVSVLLAQAGRERGVTNDLLLVAQAVAAVPLVWAVTYDDVAALSFPSQVWVLTLLCAVYFVGTVIHVKSLIRKAKDRRWHWLNIGYHALALILMSLLWIGFVVPFLACILRSAIMRPGLKPAMIGAVEMLMSLLVVLAGGAYLWIGP